MIKNSKKQNKSWSQRILLIWLVYELTNSTGKTVWVIFNIEYYLITYKCFCQHINFSKMWTWKMNMNVFVFPLFGFRVLDPIGLSYMKYILYSAYSKCKVEHNFNVSCSLISAYSTWDYPLLIMYADGARSCIYVLIMSAVLAHFSSVCQKVSGRNIKSFRKAPSL